MEPLSQDNGEVEEVSAGAGAVDTLAEDETIDFITGKPVKLKGNEEVRQRVARALYYEYGIRVQDMERDFRIDCRDRTAAEDDARRRTSRSSSPRPSTPWRTCAGS